MVGINLASPAVDPCPADSPTIPPPGLLGVVIDESYLHFSSRDSMSAGNRSIAAIINLSRQKRLTLIFVVQDARQLDIDIVSQCDVLVVKELSDLSRGFERTQLRAYTDRARKEFEATEGDRRPLAWAYSDPTGLEGMVRNELPSFWSDHLSRIFAGGPHTQGSAPARGGRRPSPNEMMARAAELRQTGLSYQKIADILGISKTQTWRLVKEAGSQP